MKKIDKLILKAFIGPFILTFLVIVFILLTVQMMNYVDEIFGKNLEWFDLGQLVFHFSIFQTPIAFPLSVMLASLMTYGNLGEHFELTAIKSAGISLTRTLVPIFILVLILTITAFFSNNYLVPHSALKAYSLLYDIRQKKPALDIEPGQFYGGIENYKIKVDKKLDDGKTLIGITIYDHTSQRGNTDVTLADSGQMYTILNDQYLKLILFNGIHYTEGKAKQNRLLPAHYRKRPIAPFTRTEFKESDMVFDLSSFGLSRTDEGLFASNRLMRNFNQLNHDLDSLTEDMNEVENDIYYIPDNYFHYSDLRNKVDLPETIVKTRHRLDSLNKLKPSNLKLYGQTSLKVPTVKNFPVYTMVLTRSNIDQEGRRIRSGASKTKNRNNKVKVKKSGKYSLRVAETSRLKSRKMLSPEDIIALVEKINRSKPVYSRALKAAVGSARQVKGKLVAQNGKIDRLDKDYYIFDIQWHKMLSQAFACITMFLIGAPLGAIIKRGGIGFPVLVSIVFFLIYHVISMTGEKYAKAGLMEVVYAVWMANYILLPIGLFFLRQARNDARLFDLDFYKVMINRLSSWLNRWFLPSRSKELASKA